jgi:formamidopyrimidine-DNA glycosylase
MPELPELEVVKDFLVEHLVGRRIDGVEVLRPIVVRNLTQDDFVSQLMGRRFTEVVRRGKYLLLSLDDLHLVIAPMLSGRLYWCSPTAKRLVKTFIMFHLEGGIDLRYVDDKQMGKVYLTSDFALVPGFAGQGPEALEVSLDTFEQRLRARRGEIKGILTSQAFLAGIGNAYADEILFRAGLYPFRRRTSLSQEEIGQLHQAMRGVLLESTDSVREQMGKDIHLKPREFMVVHGKGGTPCPQCGTPISEIRSRGRATNFCRSCQSGIMIGPTRSLR